MDDPIDSLFNEVEDLQELGDLSGAPYSMPQIVNIAFLILNKWIMTYIHATNELWLTVTPQMNYDSQSRHEWILTHSHVRLNKILPLHYQPILNHGRPLNANPYSH